MTPIRTFLILGTLFCATVTTVLGEDPQLIRAPTSRPLHKLKLPPPPEYRQVDDDGRKIRLSRSTAAAALGEHVSLKVDYLNPKGNSDWTIPDPEVAPGIRVSYRASGSDDPPHEYALGYALGSPAFRATSSGSSIRNSSYAGGPVVLRTVLAGTPHTFTVAWEENWSGRTLPPAIGRFGLEIGAIRST